MATGWRIDRRRIKWETSRTILWSSGLKFTEVCIRVVAAVMERVHRYRYVLKVRLARGADGLDVEGKGDS